MKNKFFWAVHPWQGLAESLLLGWLILAAAAGLEGSVDWFIFQAALYFLCAVCGMWAVLRIRVPQGNRLKQTGWELAVGLGLSLTLLVGLRSLSQPVGWDALWRLSTWPEGALTILIFCIGLGYFLARGGVRLWLRWERMRRQRMLWALTHSQLMALITLTLSAAGIFLLYSYWNAILDAWARAQTVPVSLVTVILTSFFPALMFTIILTVIVLAVTLPPLAVFSYFVARRTTRRLEALTSVTAALHSGDYQARVPVEGEDELAHLQADFNGMAEKLETTLADLKSERDTVARVLQSRRDLIASVSHELRTPVATLRAAIETSLDQWDGAPPDDLRHKLTVMDGEVRRLSGLIDDLFTLSQADVDNLSIGCVPTNLAPLVEQVVSAFAPLAWELARVEVSADLPSNLPTVQADPQRLQQVLLNLLRNGMRHTPPGGIVAIMASEAATNVCLDVRDTGQGIDPVDLPHIWERFYRGQNAVADGAGLGLALVKELVEAMGGSVEVESELGQGSCFRVRLKKA